MNHTQAIMRSLPLVASVLGRKYGVKVEIGGSEAYTNGETIHLPALPVDVPDTFLALARGWLDHEAGHVRNTDFEALRQAGLSPLETYVWNSIEDWRVENKLAEVFPGCRGNFNWLIKHVFGSGAPDNGLVAAAILNWILLYVRSWDVPELLSKRDTLAVQIDNQFPGVRAQIENVLTPVRSTCRSTQDAINSARQIVRILEQSASPKQEDRSLDESEAKRPERNNQGDKAEVNVPKSKLEEANKNSSKNDVNLGKRPADDNEPNAKSLPKTAKQELGALLQAQETELPATLGAILSVTLEGASRQEFSQNAITVAVQTTKQGQLLSYEDIRDATRASVTMRTRLHGLLQTSVEVRTATGRRGRIDTRNLHRLAVSDPRVFRSNRSRQALSTAVHLLLDCSGSMVRKIHLACTSCYAVGHALQTIGVNVAISAFPAEELPNGTHSTIAPIVRHGARMHNQLDLAPSGSTPMGEALWWVMQNMLPLVEKRKIILIVTDGSPDNHNCAVQAIAVAKATGFEVYGIGIGSGHISSLLPGQSKTIETMTELSPAMFAVLQTALTP